MQPLLILLAALLPPVSVAEEIIGGHVAEPHSRPYMAFVQFYHDVKKKKCGGFLVQEDFVLTAAHCLGCSMYVTLGAHDIKLQEETQQKIPVKEAVPHPKFKSGTHANDIMILQLTTKAQLTPAVGLIPLPGESDHVRDGQVCSVAGWGGISKDENTSKLHEVDVILQEDFQCGLHFENYDNSSELCAGDQEKMIRYFKLYTGKPSPEDAATPNPVSCSPAPCECSGSMKVILGAHDFKLQENTQQKISVKEAIPHPKYNNRTYIYDVMLLQLKTKAQLTPAVGLLPVPGEGDHVRPGQVCSVAGWGRISEDEQTSKLHEVDLIVQEDLQCKRYVKKYDKALQLCAGDREKKICSFKVRYAVRLA
ncbi:PREDICTED: granzyme H-like [Elephantulus edwardii]|uniref:granzyme H-like n=1 Tax=Elephantulus edwardii TaxID=28737 RepID=UPI0003F0AABB|nr:PREDICTED: granzyme H-like [Elephantulus edwardii]